MTIPADATPPPDADDATLALIGTTANALRMTKVHERELSPMESQAMVALETAAARISGDASAFAATRAALDGTEMMLWVLSEILDRDESALPFRRLVDAKRKQVSAALADAARAGGKAEG